MPRLLPSVLLISAVVTTLTAGEHRTLTPIGDTDLHAAIEWEYADGTVKIRLEAQDPAISPPWRGIRSGDHLTLTLSNASKRLDFVFPVPSYSENQMLPLAGRPPSSRQGDIITPAAAEEHQGAVSLTFDTGDATMAIENASEIRLEWRQTTGTTARVAIDSKELSPLASSTTGTLHRVNLWEQIRLRSEQDATIISLTPPPGAAIAEASMPTLTVVPKTGGVESTIHASGHRTRTTYATDIVLRPRALGLLTPATLTITIHNANGLNPPAPAASVTLQLPAAAIPQ